MVKKSGILVPTMTQIKFDFSGVFADIIGPNDGITKDELNKVLTKAADIKIDFPFMNLPQDRKAVGQIQKTADAIGCKFQNLVILGIGGSALGIR